MPPNYNQDINPTVSTGLHEPSGRTPNVVQLVQLPFKFFFCVSIVPFLSFQLWMYWTKSVMLAVMRFLLSFPQRTTSVFLYITGIRPRAMNVDIPTSNDEVELAFLQQQEETFFQRFHYLIYKILTLGGKLWGNVVEIEHQLLLIPIHADYIFDRYISHSPICIFSRIRGIESSYVFRGVPLEKTDGFQEYISKKDRVKGKIFNSDIDTETDSPLESTNIVTVVNNVNNLQATNTGISVQSESVCPFINNTDETNNLKIFESSKILEKNINHIINQKDTNMSKSHIQKISKSFTTSTIEKDNFVNIKVNGKDIKLKIVPKPKIKTYFPSISQNEVEYIALVREEIKNVLPRPGYDDGSLAPIILRLSWHCCATYDIISNTGGSNGSTMRYVPEITDEGNTGLDIARSALLPVKQKYPRMTFSDLWTLAGTVAIEEMGGPPIVWKCGRFDCRDSRFVPDNGRLPFAYKSSSHIRETFTRMGFDDRETVALLGAHGLGRCHKRFSGWEGKWTYDPLKFDNSFFTVLLEEKWSAGKVPETGKDQFYNQDKSLMMLNTDLELIRDSGYKKWVQQYAEDEELFKADFSNLFAKLLELGIKRDELGNVKPKDV